MTMLNSCGCCKRYMDTIYGGTCWLCKELVCEDCVQEYRLRKYPTDTKYPIDAFPLLSPEYVSYLNTIDRNLEDRFLIVICYKCIAKTEQDLINSTPIEQIPLLINVRWYGDTSDQVYKDRYSHLSNGPVGVR